MCHCYKGFFGGDCSYRHCPQGPSWTVTPLEDYLDDRYAEDIVLRTPGGFVGKNRYDPLNPYPIQETDFSTTFEDLYPKRPAFNQYTECSSRGTCDYATGECKCFDGFEGRGCRRTTCPNDCSGHGRCMDNKDMNSQYYSYNYENDQMWDQMRTQSCKCDRGFTGFDCASRICPFGDDPTSDCGENSAGDVQLVATLADATENGGANTYFTLTFTDMFNGEYTTRPIQDQRCTVGKPCWEVQYALMDLPNFAIPEVEVDYLSRTLSGTAPNQKAASLYTIHFTDSSNAGKQNTLKCEIVSDSTVDGAQPKYKGVDTCEVFNVGGPEWFDASGESLQMDISTPFTGVATLSRTSVLGSSNTADSATSYEDFQPCAAKGDCDSSTGTCTCNAGHFGEACEKQSTYY